jgi:hypothetical protein
MSTPSESLIDLINAINKKADAEESGTLERYTDAKLKLTLQLEALERDRCSRLESLHKARAETIRTAVLSFEVQRKVKQ